MPTPPQPTDKPSPQRFDPAELRIEAWPPSPERGMIVPRISAGVRVVHLPSGREVVCTEHRSQHHNRAAALAELARQLAGSDV